MDVLFILSILFLLYNACKSGINTITKPFRIAKDKQPPVIHVTRDGEEIEIKNVKNYQKHIEEGHYAFFIDYLAKTGYYDEFF